MSKRPQPERGATSLRQGYGGPPELQRRRKPPSESERGWGPASAEKCRPSAGGTSGPQRGRDLERLQKILSAAGVASRRHSETLILEGRVTVNGDTVTELGTKADPAHDDIRVDGRRLRMAHRMRYILLNKPRGYVTTRSDPQRRPTVIDLLKNVREYVYPVGRLDYDSEGLLLLTNDGDLAARLTHPSHEVERVYEARVRGIPDGHELRRLERGLIIDGRRTAPARVQLTHRPATPSGPQAVLLLTIHEGRHRQVRKMLEAIGHPVVRLRRVRIGPIADETLKTGHYRELAASEVAALKRVAGI